MTEVQSIHELGDAWDEAIERCAFHDAHHHAAYHRAMGGDGAPLLLCSGSDDPAAWAFPLLLRPLAAVAPGHDGFDAVGVDGFGGIAWDPERVGESDWPQIWEAVRDLLLSLGVVSVFSRWHPLDASDMPLPAHAVLGGLGESVVIDLGRDDATYLAGLQKGHRYDVRRAERDGLVVDATSTATFLDEFYDLYLDTMQRVGANHSYYFGRDRLRHLYGDDRFTVLTLRARRGRAT